MKPDCPEYLHGRLAFLKSRVKRAVRSCHSKSVPTAEEQQHISRSNNTYNGMRRSRLTSWAIAIMSNERPRAGALPASSRGDHHPYIVERTMASRSVYEIAVQLLGARQPGR